jgi:hypothetical protein
MVESILSTVLSIPYIVIGACLVAFIDYKIYKSKVTTRFTTFQILGCIMGWPILVGITAILYIGLSGD